VVAAEVHGDLRRAEVVVLPQVNDLLDDLGGCLVRAVRRPGGPVPQPGQAALGLVAAVPGVEDLPADPVVPAGHGHVPGDLAGVADDRQPPGSVLVQFFYSQRSPITQGPQMSTVSVSFRGSGRRSGRAA
jgi:hypothetical protein